MALSALADIDLPQLIATIVRQHFRRWHSSSDTCPWFKMHYGLSRAWSIEIISLLFLSIFSMSLCLDLYHSITTFLSSLPMPGLKLPWRNKERELIVINTILLPCKWSGTQLYLVTLIEAFSLAAVTPSYSFMRYAQASACALTWSYIFRSWIPSQTLMALNTRSFFPANLDAFIQSFLQKNCLVVCFLSAEYFQTQQGT